MTALNERDGEFSGSDLESFEMPETVLCVDTICHICSAEFLHEEDLKVHITQQHITEQSKSRYCQLCASIFASLEEYALHIIEVHILSLKCCKYCMRVFTLTQDVKTHEKKHLSSSSKFQLSCSNCNMTFNNVSRLELHESSKHSDSKDGVLLRDCYSLLSSLLNIKAPVFLKSLGTTQEYKCGNCYLLTSDVEYYIQHLQQKNCRSLVCDKCCGVYQNLASLKQHFKTHLNCQSHINEYLQRPCTKCEKVFNYDQMQEHTKICEAVKCHSCDVIFETVNERTEHQTKVHPLMFSIKNCKYCHHDFVGRDALEKHIKRTHGKDIHLYKYFCIYCKDIFKHPKKLFTHFLTKHKDLKPFTCKTCNKTFRLRKNFTLHIKLDHSSIGTVKFDDNYHVIFEQGIASSTEGGRNENQDKSVMIEKEKNIEDNSQHLLVPAKKKLLERRSDVDLVLYPTENETDQPDKKKEKKIVKRRRKTKNKDVVDCIDLTLEDGTEDSDDEPLIKKRRRAKMRLENIKFPKWNLRSKEMRRNRQKFTCKICKKYCYTYQNFHHHMSLHQRNLNKKCIKCPRVFKTNEKLKRHIAKEHSTSKLTETLKSVLERRKNSTNNTKEQKRVEIDRKAITEKFLKTIKKVNNNISETSVKITPIINKLSAKKFIENFTPESSGINCKGNTIYTNNSLTIKAFETSKKPPLIKLIKSSLKQPVFTKLKQPERFKDETTERYEVSIKIADQGAKPKMNFYQPEEESIAYEEREEAYDDDSLGPVIPEVAEEVMLDETEEIKPKDILHKLVLPKLPDYKDVHIAHLLPEAPYYKIVKIDEVLNEKPEDVEQEKQVQLLDGTKLVSVNPLAHLLEGKQVDLQTNKYYKPKLVNFEKALANALLKLKNTKANKSRQTKKSKIVNEQ